MVIKSYLGESVAEALKKIRSELGPKAMVLKTRALNASESGVGRRMVEITACLEKPTVGALDASLSEAPPIAAAIAEEPVIHSRLESATATPTPESRMSAAQQFASGLTNEEYAKRLEEKLDLILDRQERPSLQTAYPEPVSEVGHALLNHDIPERFVRPLLVRLSERTAKEKSANALEVAEQMLTDEFAQYCIPDFSLKAGDRALFIGPSGCGKTTALGKMAAELLFKRRIKTELSTLDDFRVAAQEEIAGYSEALGAALVDSTGAVESFSEKTNRALLIDCHSNINDQRQFMGLLEKSRALRPTVVFLTISALMRSADLSRLVRRFNAFSPTHAIVTHNDLTETVGGIYTTLKELGIKLAALTDSPGSLGSLKSPDPAALARRVFRRED